MAIVRISGPAARDICARIFRARGPLVPRLATIGDIIGDDGVAIDRGLALFFPNPHSYTGEDVLELQVHGSPAVARDTLIAALAAGARLATPGEFTRRAFLAGKLDLSAAEAVGELIEAEQRSAARAAAARVAGGLAAEVERLGAMLSRTLERLAAALDFPDEVEPETPAALLAAVRVVDDALAELEAGWETGRVLRDGLAVAIVGPPNAGKSSLLNALLGIDRALVSAHAGTTRDTIEEILALPGGVTIRAIDTAGLRDAADELEAAGVARSEAALANAAAALVVVDGAAPLSAEARRALERTRGRERIVYFNKRDLGRTGYDARDAAERDALFGSVHDPETIEAIRSALVAYAGGPAVDVARPMLGTARQADAVLEARRALADASATLEAGDPVDLIAADLGRARAALGGLTGRDAGEALLDAIFARFCIGK